MNGPPSAAPAPAHAPAPAPAPAPLGIAYLSRQARDALFAELGSCAQGLTAAEARERLGRLGPNDVTQSRHQSIAREILLRLRTPLNALLLILGMVSLLTGDARAAIVIAVMVLLSVSLDFVQEHRSSRAAEVLRAMVRTTASVFRPGTAEGVGGEAAEVPIDTNRPRH